MRKCKKLASCILGSSGDKICRESDCPPHLTQSEGYKLYMSFFEPKGALITSPWDNVNAASSAIIGGSCSRTPGWQGTPSSGCLRG